MAVLQILVSFWVNSKMANMGFYLFLSSFKALLFFCDSRQFLPHSSVIIGGHVTSP